MPLGDLCSPGAGFLDDNQDFQIRVVVKAGPFKIRFFTEFFDYWGWGDVWSRRSCSACKGLDTGSMPRPRALAHA